MVSESVLHLSNISIYTQRYLPVIASASKYTTPDYSRHFMNMENLLKNLLGAMTSLTGAIIAVESSRYFAKNQGKFDKKLETIMSRPELSQYKTYMGLTEDQQTVSSAPFVGTSLNPVSNASIHASQQAGMTVAKDIWGPDKVAGVSHMASFMGRIAKLGSGVKSIGGEWSKTASSMTKTALVMQPMNAFMSGFLEPFSMIGEMFGEYGEILGTMFYPILTDIDAVLSAGMPYAMMLAEFLGGLLKWVFDFIFPVKSILAMGEQLGTLNMEAVGLGISDWFLNLGGTIAGWLSMIDWGALGGQLGTWASEFVGNIIGWLSMIDWGALGGQLGTWAGEFVGNIIGWLTTVDWGAVGLQLLDWGGKFIGFILQSLVGAVVNFGEFASNFIKQLWDALVNSIKSWFK